LTGLTLLSRRSSKEGESTQRDCQGWFVWKVRKNRPGAWTITIPSKFNLLFLMVFPPFWTRNTYPMLKKSNASTALF